MADQIQTQEWLPKFLNLLRSHQTTPWSQERLHEQAQTFMQPFAPQPPQSPVFNTRAVAGAQPSDLEKAYLERLLSGAGGHQPPQSPVFNTRAIDGAPSSDLEKAYLSLKNPPQEFWESPLSEYYQLVQGQQDKRTAPAPSRAEPPEAMGQHQTPFDVHGDASKNAFLPWDAGVDLDDPKVHQLMRRVTAGQFSQANPMPQAQPTFTAAEVRSLQNLGSKNLGSKNPGLPKEIPVEPLFPYASSVRIDPRLAVASKNRAELWENPPIDVPSMTTGWGKGKLSKAFHHKVKQAYRREMEDEIARQESIQPGDYSRRPLPQQSTHPFGGVKNAYVGLGYKPPHLIASDEVNPFAQELGSKRLDGRTELEELANGPTNNISQYMVPSTVIPPPGTEYGPRTEQEYRDGLSGASTAKQFDAATKKVDADREDRLKKIRENLAKQKEDLNTTRLVQQIAKGLGRFGEYGPITAGGVMTGKEGFGAVGTPELDAAVAREEQLTDPLNDPDSPQSMLARDFMEQAFGARMPETATYSMIASQHPSLARMMQAREQAAGRGGKKAARTLPQAAVRARMDIKHSVNMLDELVKRYTAPDSPIPNFVGPWDGRIIQFDEWLGTIKPEAKQFRQRLAIMRNNYIRAITGAQMSEREAVRIMTALPTEVLNDATFLASLTEARDILNEQLTLMDKGFAGAGYQPVSGSIVITSDVFRRNGAPEWVIREAEAAERAHKAGTSGLLPMPGVYSKGDLESEYPKGDLESELRDKYPEHEIIVD